MTTPGVGDRLEVRLDPERRRKLTELAAGMALPVSAVVRELIDRGYDESRREERRRAVARIAALELEELPEPDALCEQLDGFRG